MQLEQMLTSATKQKQWHIGHGRFGSHNQDIFKKHVTSERTKHATNLSLKLLIDFLGVHGFNPDILTLVKIGAIGNTRLQTIYYQ